MGRLCGVKVKVKVIRWITRELLLVLHVKKLPVCDPIIYHFGNTAKYLQVKFASCVSNHLALESHYDLWCRKARVPDIVRR